MTDFTPWYPTIAPILLWILEMCLATIWQPALFRSGLPVFRRSFPLNRDSGIKLDVGYLNKEFENDTFPSLLFHKISDNEYLFREAVQIRPMGYAPIIRGQIFIEPTGSDISVTGRMNWILVAVLFLMLTTFISAGIQVFDLVQTVVGLAILFPLVVGVTAGFQVSRFEKVARSINRMA